MPLLTIISTCPFLLVAHSRKHNPEKYYTLKLITIWLLTLVYITLNNSIKFPIGMICAILIVYRTNFNKLPKLLALLIGLISLLLSSLIYLLFAK